LLSPLSYKRWYAEFYVGENPTNTYWPALAAAAMHGFTMVLLIEPVSRRNTFVGGACALQSALLVFNFFSFSFLLMTFLVFSVHIVYVSLALPAIEIKGSEVEVTEY